MYPKILKYLFDESFIIAISKVWEMYRIWKDSIYLENNNCNTIK